jgi:hypothetical protein
MGLSMYRAMGTREVHFGHRGDEGLSRPLVCAIVVEGVRMTVRGPLIVLAVIVLPCTFVMTASVLMGSARRGLEIRMETETARNPAFRLNIFASPACASYG